MPKTYSDTANDISSLQPQNDTAVTWLISSILDVFIISINFCIYEQDENET